MSWIILTAANLDAYLVADQLDALRTQALAEGQGDPFDEVAPDVIRKVRSYIASNPINRVDSAELTIPAELKLDVCHLILDPMLGRLGITLTADQVRRVEAAEATLRALRDGKLVVSAPEVPVAPDIQPINGVEQVAPGDGRKFTRDSLDSL